MDLLIIAAITCFFGFVALSMIGSRNAPPSARVVVLRADQLSELDGERGSAGFGIFLLFAVIIAAIWLL